MNLFRLMFINLNQKLKCVSCFLYKLYDSSEIVIFIRIIFGERDFYAIISVTRYKYILLYTLTERILLPKICFQGEIKLEKVNVNSRLTTFAL